MNGNNRGFTLLEAVVALAILSLVLASLTVGFRTMALRTQKLCDKAEAWLVAASLRDRLGRDIPLDRPKSEGHDEHCKWSIESTPARSVALTSSRVVQGYDVGMDVECGVSYGRHSVHLSAFELAAHDL